MDLPNLQYYHNSLFLSSKSFKVKQNEHKKTLEIKVPHKEGGFLSSLPNIHVLSMKN